MKKFLYFLFVLFTIICKAQVPPICFPQAIELELHDSTSQVSEPVGTVNADFNNDGIQDIAAASSMQYAYINGVLLGNGDGTFKPIKFFISKKGQASGMVAADLNNDGNLDLIISHSDSNEVVTFLGDGKGDFKQDSVYKVGTKPINVIAFDFDRDRKVDIATINSTANTCTVWYGNGKGKLDTSVTISLAFQPTVFTTDYIVGDTMPDIAIAGYKPGAYYLSYVQVWRTTGSNPRNFSGGTASSVTATPFGITTGDFDNDKKIDIAVSSGFEGKGILFFKGVNSTTLSTPKSIDNLSDQQSLLSYDMNGDGYLDIVAGNKILLGKNDGTFKQTFIYLNTWRIVNVADFNRDGMPDILSWGRDNISGSGIFRLILGKGNGVVDEGHYEVNSSDVIKFDIADLDNNGYADLYGISPYSMAGNKNLVVEWRFRDTVVQSVYTLADYPLHVFPVQLDTYGRTDLVIETNSGFEFWYNNGSGFGRLANIKSTGGYMGASGDINGDGLKDLATFDPNTDKLNLFVASKSSPWFTTSSYKVIPGYDITEIVEADFNKDGLADFAVTTYQQDKLTVFYGQKSGSLTSGTSYGCGKRPRDIKYGDFNGDKILDIAVDNIDYSEVTVLLGNSAGTFNSATSYSLPGIPFGLYVEDFDKDGYDDVCAPNTAFKTRQITIFKGAPSGTLKSPVNYSITGIIPHFLTVGDYNNDSINDLAFGGGGSQQIGINLGLGKGVFDTTTYQINTNENVNTIYPVDMNGDNKLDLAFTGNKTGWYLNESSIVSNKYETYCDSAVLNAGEGYKYKWSTGDTTSTTTVKKTGDYYVTTQTIYGCGAKSPVRHIKIVPGPHFPVISATNDTVFCKGDSSTLTISRYQGETYQWYRNDTLIKSATDTFFTVKKACRIKVKVTNANGCKSQNAVLIGIDQPLPVKIASLRDSVFCEGDSDVLNATAYTKGVKYLWYKDGKLLANDTLPKLTAKQSGAYQVQLASGRCLTPSNTIKVKMNPLPKVILSFAGPSVSCTTDSIYVKATADSGALLSWYKNNRLIAANTRRVTFGTATTADIYVIASLNGCKSSSNTVHAVFYAPAKASVTVKGSLNLCKGQTVTFTQKADTGLTYAWYKNNALYAGTNVIAVKDSGDYKVVVATRNGCHDTSQEYEVIVNDLPVANIRVAGKLQICAGDTAKLIADYNSKYKYTWQRNKTTISSAKDTLLNATQSGSYRVIVQNAAQCYDTSSEVSVTVNPLPAALITLNGKVLQASTGSGYTYQWYRNDSIIKNATGSNFVPGSAGKYYVLVTSASGCSRVSNSINFIPVGVSIQNFTPGEQLTVYPNPSYGDFNLTYSSEYTGSIRILVQDLTGRKVMDFTLQKTDTEIHSRINLQDKSSGTYLLSVFGQGTSKSIKIFNLKN